MNITNDIVYLGVFDNKVDLFEGQYKVPDGISYNSYMIKDEKTAIFDTVDVKFQDEWLNNVDKKLNGKNPDFLVIQHMEPDHSSAIYKFIKKYKGTKIVATSKAFDMMKQFFNYDFKDEQIVVKDGDTLSLGKHTLKFMTAPMVHWPEVMVTYDEEDKVLFSADAFGKFGKTDDYNNWEDEARRYYIGIVGKYGPQVQSLMKKAAGIDIKTICPLHGPVLKDNLSFYLELYNKWSSYTPEKDGIVINFTSIYGNTKKAVLLLEEELTKKGYEVTVNDLARCDIKKAVADSFKYPTTVLATTTYNNEIFPFMREFIANLIERNFQKRKIAFIENGSWAPSAIKVMKSKLEGLKEIEFIDETVSIKSAVNDDNIKEIKNLADKL